MLKNKELFYITSRLVLLYTGTHRAKQKNHKGETAGAARPR